MKPLPFPLELVIECPVLATTDALVLGATVSALHAFWRSGCVALPEDDVGLSVVARCNAARWYRVRGSVKGAISELIPTLTAVYAQKRKAASGKQAIGRLGGLARVAKSKAKAQLTAGKIPFSALDAQRGMRPPLELPQNAATKVVPTGGRVFPLTGHQTAPIPIQPVRLLPRHKAAASQGMPRGKSDIWLTD